MKSLVRCTRWRKRTQNESMDLDIEEYVEFSINDEMSDSDYLLKMHVSSSESDSSESNFSLNED